MTFEVGDRVRLVDNHAGYEYIERGSVGEVEAANEGPLLRVKFSGHDATSLFASRLEPLAEESDNVNHPAHYNWLPKGIEVIDITENLNFCMGNAVKYVLRADHKGNPVEDLRKAKWYIDREIERRTK